MDARGPGHILQAGGQGVVISRPVYLWHMRVSMASNTGDSDGTSDPI